MTGFVDDKNARTNTFESTNQPTDEELIKLAQTDAQLWRDLLASSGGKLEPLKCCYYMMKTIFASSGAPILQGGIGPESLVVKDENGTETKLKIVSNFSSKKGLGYWKSPCDNEQQQK